MMRVGIVHMYPFPLGMAATNRIIAYSKGLIADNVSVKIYCLNPYYPKNKNTSINKNGVYENVPYHYFLHPYRYKNNLLHKAQIFLSIIKSISYFYKSFKNKELDILIISSEKKQLLWIYSLIAKKNNAKSIFIFDEYPSTIRYETNKNKIKKEQNKYTKILKNITAFIAIIHKINDFYNKNLNKPYLIFPTITDTSKFSHICDPKLRVERLCYMGSLDLQKDNVDLIIQAFAKIKDNYPLLTFEIYGKANENEKQILQAYIMKYNLQNKVFLMGPVEFSKVPHILTTSKILVSSQKNTMRIQGGLSTKLGEYLVSGTPVLLSDVGDIKNQVQENKHLFLAPPNDVNAYADKLSFILDNYDFALSIAKTGRNFILKNFSHIEMGKKLHVFLNKL